MKQQIVNLKKKLLVVELLEGANRLETFKDDLPYLFYFSDDKPKRLDLLSDCILIGKLTDIKEEQLSPLVDKFNDGAYRNYNGKDSFYPDANTNNILLTAKESFFSALRANGIYFENPLDGTDVKLETGDLGVDDAEWQEAESKKWDINNCWLFEIL